MFSDRAGMSASTCVLLSLTKCCASSLLPNGITECPAPKPLSGAVIQRRTSFTIVEIFTMFCSHSVPCHLILKRYWYWFFSAMLSWWQYSVIRLHLACFLFASFSNLLPAMRHQDKRWQNVWTNSSKPMWLSGKMLRSEWIWLLLTTALCLNVISLGARLVWTRSTAHSIPGECCRANYEKERQH